MADEIITSDCFKDMTIEGQLYEILVAIDQIDPNGGVPAIHAPSHFSDGSDPIAPENIGAVSESRSIVAGVGLTGGGDLSANRTFQVLFGNTEGTVCEGNDPRLAGLSSAGTFSASNIEDFTESVEAIIETIDAGQF